MPFLLVIIAVALRATNRERDGWSIGNLSRLLIHEFCDGREPVRIYHVQCGCFTEGADKIVCYVVLIRLHDGGHDSLSL